MLKTLKRKKCAFPTYKLGPRPSKLHSIKRSVTFSLNPALSCYFESEIQFKRLLNQINHFIGEGNKAGCFKQ